jgi:hypothetical protein
MKTLFTLSFLLLFILVSRFGYANSGADNNTVDISSLAWPAKKQSSETAAMVGLNVTETAHDNDLADEVIGVEEDDQDEVNKPVSSRYFIAFYYPFFPEGGAGALTGCRPFYKPFVCNRPGKYLTLRVLRI